jgi:hypothetical protein
LVLEAKVGVARCRRRRWVVVMVGARGSEAEK